MSETKDVAAMADQYNTTEVLNDALSKAPAALVVPENFQLLNVENLRTVKARASSKFVTPSIDAFLSYSNERAGDADNAGVFISSKTGEVSARCVFNRGTFDAPCHGDDYAVLCLRSTVEHSTLHRFNGQPFTQRQFVDFLEEWENHITFTDADGNEMSNSSAIAAFRRVTVERHNETAAHLEDMAETHSSMEQVEARSEFLLPSHFSFKCEPFEGLSEVTYICRVRGIFNDAKPQFKYRIFQESRVRKEIEGDAWERLVKGLDPLNVEIYEGEFTA